MVDFLLNLPVKKSKKLVLEEVHLFDYKVIQYTEYLGGGGGGGPLLPTPGDFRSFFGDSALDGTGGGGFLADRSCCFINFATNFAVFLSDN